jgi:hypothetical protein
MMSAHMVVGPVERKGIEQEKQRDETMRRWSLAGPREKPAAAGFIL